MTEKEIARIGAGILLALLVFVGWWFGWTTIIVILGALVLLGAAATLFK
jgi:hypothetical protein